ncbi:MAG: TlpA family protein disulfide reductase [Pyrinomonadaceae bacterium]|nr:TlpA family protein disulfide reductase [Pyrinomonadaceae bacterium]MCX7640100.1 TlpA family protein disulfide reductase [Pyrinomonadaceae bacterium]MDW8304272.1 TlpA disulfide reductase family protein [Acidobacteriota bacterium]
MKATLTLLFLLVCFTVLTGQDKPKAYDFSFADLQGNLKNLSDLNGKVVLLLFWSTSCPICQAEITSLNELASKHKDKNVVFLALTVESPEKTRKFLEKHNFLFDVAFVDLGTASEYGERDERGNFFLVYPTYFLIDEKGRITLKEKGSGKTKILDSFIERLLNRK